MGVKRVITRVGNAITATLFEKVGVDIALSAKGAAVNEIKNKIIDTKQTILATVERGLAEIIKIDIKQNQEDKMIKDFSTGMLMKLKIVTVLSHNSELLILDEPTSGLDPIARSEILDIFQEFVEDENHSIFVSSHITSDLEQVADYIVFISNGEIILSENKDKLIEEYAIVKCTKDEFNNIDKKDILKYKKNKYNYQVLISDKSKFKKK